MLIISFRLAVEKLFNFLDNKFLIPSLVFILLEDLENLESVYRLGRFQFLYILMEENYYELFESTSIYNFYFFIAFI
jgi:hypothetical protein